METLFLFSGSKGLYSMSGECIKKTGWYISWVTTWNGKSENGFDGQIVLDWKGFKTKREALNELDKLQDDEGLKKLRGEFVNQSWIEWASEHPEMKFNIITVPR